MTIDGRARVGAWVIAFATLGVAGSAAQSSSTTPPLTGSIVFLYYEDIERAATFYGKTLGLEETYHRPQVRGVYAVTPSSAVGLIGAVRGGNLDLTTKTAGVSFIVDELGDVDRWYARLESRGVKAERPSNGTETPVRSVQFTDPEGYEMEVFAWLPER